MVESPEESPLSGFVGIKGRRQTWPAGRSEAIRRIFHVVGRMYHKENSASRK
jgi:hypothetical protein